MGVEHNHGTDTILTCVVLTHSFTASNKLSFPLSRDTTTMDLQSPSGSPLVGSASGFVPVSRLARNIFKLWLVHGPLTG